MQRSLLFTFCLAAVLLLAACGGKAPEPTATPEIIEPTEEEAPQISPLETCAASITLPGQPSYPPIYCDQFEDPSTVAMPLGEDENKYGKMTLDVYNGKYTARVEVKRDNNMWLNVPVEDVRDFIIQVDGKLASHSGHPYHSLGIFFKADADLKNYYYFMVDNNQFYYFALVRDEKVTNLINGRKTEDLNPLDEGNTITVASEGDTYSFYINDSFQEDFKDNRLLTGGIGLFSQMRKDTTLDWEFDNLVVYGQ
jgi:hypothetical protein